MLVGGRSSVRRDRDCWRRGILTKPEQVVCRVFMASASLRGGGKGAPGFDSLFLVDFCGAPPS